MIKNNQHVVDNMGFKSYYIYLNLKFYYIKHTKTNVVMNVIGLKFWFITKFQSLKLKFQERGGKKEEEDIGGFGVLVPFKDIGKVFIIILK